MTLALYCRRRRVGARHCVERATVVNRKFAGAIVTDIELPIVFPSGIGAAHRDFARGLGIVTQEAHRIGHDSPVENGQAAASRATA